MFESIKKVKEQFLWDPEIMGKPLDFAQGKWVKRVIICGVGGSNLASGFLEMVRPDLEILTHRSYGLPVTVSKNDLIIISSYSGNTEEALDSFEKAVSGRFNVVAITMGGKLLELVKEKNIPYIQIPQTGIEPRMALGYSLIAMLKAVNDEENLIKVQEFGKNFNPENFEKEGRGFAEKLAGKTPIIYSSWNNKAIAYAWKIKFNETAKIPAFFNVFPELNHNEMVGFVAANKESKLGFEKEKPSLNSFFIFLKDPEDHPRIQKRMGMTAELYKNRSLPVEVLKLEGKNQLIKIFSSVLIADWTSYYIAQEYGVEAEQVPMVEEFKKLIV